MWPPRAENIMLPCLSFDWLGSQRSIHRLAVAALSFAVLKEFPDSPIKIKLLKKLS